MPIFDEKNILALKTSKNARLLGLDVGEKTIGLSLSDTTLMLASPYKTIRRTAWSKDWLLLEKVLGEFEIFGLVIGLPINMDGSEGPRCQSIRQFAANILEKRDMPICFWDERLSTVAVTRTLLEADVSREKRKAAVDKMAAAYILQGLLDRLSMMAKGI